MHHIKLSQNDNGFTTIGSMLNLWSETVMTTYDKCMETIMIFTDMTSKTFIYGS